MQWTAQDLVARQRSHPVKLALAARLWQETTLSVKQIAERLHLGKPGVNRFRLRRGFLDSAQVEVLAGFERELALTM